MYKSKLKKISVVLALLLSVMPAQAGIMDLIQFLSTPVSSTQQTVLNHKNKVSLATGLLLSYYFGPRQAHRFHIFTMLKKGMRNAALINFALRYHGNKQKQLQEILNGLQQGQQKHAAQLSTVNTNVQNGNAALKAGQEQAQQERRALQNGQARLENGQNQIRSRQSQLLLFALIAFNYLKRQNQALITGQQSMVGAIQASHNLNERGIQNLQAGQERLEQGQQALPQQITKELFAQLRNHQRALPDSTPGQLEFKNQNGTR